MTHPKPNNPGLKDLLEAIVRSVDRMNPEEYQEYIQKLRNDYEARMAQYRKEHPEFDREDG